MKAQRPANGILKQNSIGGSVSYKISCQCGDDGCTQTVWIESDEDSVQVNTYTKQTTNSWRQLIEPTSNIKSTWLYSLRYGICNVINSIYSKLKLTHEIWANGHIDYQAELIMNKQQALNYGKILQSVADTKVKNSKPQTKKLKNQEVSAKKPPVTRKKSS